MADTLDTMATTATTVEPALEAALAPALALVALAPALALAVARVPSETHSKYIANSQHLTHKHMVAILLLFKNLQQLCKEIISARL